METIKLRDEYIKLGQALKAAGLVETGADAKSVIQDGQVLVNGVTECQRGKKLYDGDVVTFDRETIKIVK
ncbi:RNA-binding S4 domain-containing protein [Murimonas intestini]|uniref:Ribosome-associated protein n=1 Tax=Murimonas intestini TaxID=1337051 RepID=A0AB73SXX0_9FIRM|nr:RNA-binding S4 domain-containing protein [Murimonas intestini]MCR1843127.1 RNA-binding S4 domain-containing protein [Murimonas intestini]MCR1868436.1 RNA-binding S4 domain-containing protein [Murimonas intestini]MCR1885880.1 RNA-binding S4 domain-containing protein [Murimonas intestini]